RRAGRFGSGRGPETRTRAGIIAQFCGAGPRSRWMSFGFVFPGQGSQSLGMLAALASAERRVRATFDEASTAPGYDLWRLGQEGPESGLNATGRTQPAMLAAGVGTWRLLRHPRGRAPAVVSGPRLGEIPALGCSA